MDHLKVKTVKNLVVSHTGLNLDSRYKTDPLIKARAICYKILKDECNMSYTYIGKQFGKHHATIMHSHREFKWMVKADKDMERKYNLILNLYKEEKDQYTELTPAEIKKTLKDLAEQNKMLNLSVINVQKELKERLIQLETKIDKLISSV